MVSLITIHYDAIQSIISFLDSHDALSLSLTSRYFYDLAINQVSASVHCTSPEKLISAWKVFVGDTPDRARYVRVLRTGIIQDHPAELVRGGQDHYVRFRDLLLQARNISHILLLGAYLMAHQGISAAMQSLQHLTHLEIFGGYDSRTLSVIEGLHSPLHVLSLRAHENRASPLLDVLVSLTPHWSSLRALRVTGRSHLPHVSLDKYRHRPPRFPHCRRLILAQAYYHPIVDLTATFPNVDVINFPYIRVQLLHNKVPPLRHLELHANRMSQLAGHLSEVRYLHLFNAVLLLNGSGVTLQATLDAIREVSPVALHLNISSSSADANMVVFWDGLASAAPHLRCLDLAFEPTSSYACSGVGYAYQEIALYLNKLAFHGDTSPLPIQCLRIGLSFFTAFRISLHSRAWFDGEEPAEDQRLVADAILALPGIIAAAIPTLRYLALSTQADYYPIIVEDWYNQESDYDLHALDEDVTWWRIERKGDRQTFHRMGVTDGARVWRSLIEVCGQQSVPDSQSQ